MWAGFAAGAGDDRRAVVVASRRMRCNAADVAESGAERRAVLGAQDGPAYPSVAARGADQRMNPHRPPMSGAAGEHATASGVAGTGKPASIPTHGMGAAEEEVV